MKQNRLLRTIQVVMLAILMVFTQFPAVSYAGETSDGSLGSVRVIVENTTFTPETASSLGAVWEDSYWYGTLVDETVQFNENSTMMSCVVAALDKHGYSQTGAENNYISEINGLEASDGGAESGWMGTLNDWFANAGFGEFTVASGKLSANDEIRIMYTSKGYGADLGGTWENNDKSLKSVSFSVGELDSEFMSTAHDYYLDLPAGTSSVKATPTAANKNFMVKTFVGDKEYKRSEEIPVSNGTEIIIKCGDPSWPTMNDAADVPAEEYSFIVRILKTPTFDASVTMNADTPKAKLFASSDTEKSDDLFEGITASNNTYSVELAAGSYLLEGYNAASEFNGSIYIDVKEDQDNKYQVRTAYNYFAQNSGFVLGTDYEIETTVKASDGTLRQIQVGEYTKWDRTCPAVITLDGDTVTANYTPSAEREAEGYIGTSKTVTMSKNQFIDLQATLPHTKLITINAPTGSTISAGRFYRYYKYDFAQVEEMTDNGIQTTAKLRVPEGSGSYFYRVQNPNGVTYWNFVRSLDSNQTINVTAEDLHIGDTEFNKDTVYSDFAENKYDLGSIYMNINRKEYLNLNVGETYTLNMFRNWQAIENFMNSQIALPDFHYEIIDEQGDPSDVVSIEPNENNSAWGTLKAEKEGTAIVLVTYDSMTHKTAMGGERLSAIWPEFTGVFVVKVGGEESDIDTNMVIDRLNGTSGEVDAEHDILFYTGENGAEYSFKPEEGSTVSIARSSIKDGKMTFDGFSSEGITVADDGTVTLSGLTGGRHIVRVAKGDEVTYQVLTARQVSYTLTDEDGNELTSAGMVKPGESVTIQFNGLVHPIEKMAGAYNFHATLHYLAQDNETGFENKATSPFGVYDFSSDLTKQKITVKVPEDWDFDNLTLHGAIKEGGFANVGFGGHRGFAYETGYAFNPSSPNKTGHNAVLPVIRIAVDLPVKNLVYDGNGNDGGTVPESDTSHFSTDVLTILDNVGEMTKTGNDFAGWNTSSDGSGTAYNAGDTLALANGSVTLYAQWTPKQYTVTWVGSDGAALESDSVPYGTVPEYSGTTPTKASDDKYDYTFAGWDPQVATVTGDVTYTAQFDAKEKASIAPDENGKDNAGNDNTDVKIAGGKSSGGDSKDAPATGDSNSSSSDAAMMVIAFLCSLLMVYTSLRRHRTED